MKDKWNRKAKLPIYANDISTQTTKAPGLVAVWRSKSNEFQLLRNVHIPIHMRTRLSSSCLAPQIGPSLRPSTHTQALLPELT